MKLLKAWSGAGAALTLLLTVTAPLSPSVTRSAQAAIDTIYFTQAGGELDRVSLDGSDLKQVVGGLSRPQHIAVDPRSKLIYWTNFGSPGSIMRCSFDGSGQQVILPGLVEPRGIALDLVHDKIYWTSASAVLGVLARCNLDGSSPDTLATDLGFAEDVAVDPVAQQAYWVENDASLSDHNSIWRVNFDGKGKVALLDTLSGPGGIALDTAAGTMYWTDRDRNRIRRAKLDGSGVEDLVTTGVDSPIGIALDLDAGRMYWVDNVNNKIQQADLDGSNLKDVLALGLHDGVGIALAETGGVPVLGGRLQARQDPGGVELRWMLWAGDGLAGLRLLRSVDGAEPVAVGGLLPATVGSGEFLDPVSGLESGATLVYRLQALASDGSEQTLGSDAQLRWSVTPVALARLDANFPNPFNPSTTLRFLLSRPAHVRLSVVDERGREVAVLVDGPRSAGTQRERWDGRDDRGVPVGSGVYRALLEVEGRRQSRPMLLVR